MSALDFAAYFEDVHGFPPFPWQARLADHVLRAGWPALLDLPTASGKTSALDIALFALAADPASAPRRVFLVVDRRIVVDQGALHARRIRRRLMDGAAPGVAAGLRALFGGGDTDEPFAVAVLRGGMPREDEWAARPDQPVLGVSTVDQVGSRLLFRGYGVSERMAPVHAGLLGNDTLFLLDEVHLAQPFEETLNHIETRWRGREPLCPRFSVVRMSATPGSARPDAWRLDEADRANPRLAKRLRATKSARLVEVRVSGEEPSKRSKLAAACARDALALVERGARVVGVVVNRVDTARETWRILDARSGAFDAVLLTGRMRPIDRDAVLGGPEGVLARAGARPRSERACPRPLVLVATQCIEAGADLDLDALVTECASLDALRQRCGRLDRRGELGESPAVVLMRSDQVRPKRDDPVYGPALPATWAWLAAQGDKVLLGVDEMQLPDAEEVVAMLAPRASSPILLPAHLDAWSQTCPRPAPDPDVSLWLHGPERGAPEVQIVWRADIDDRALEETASDDTGEALGALIALLAACRPSGLEALSVPIYAARAWLRAAAVQPEVDDLINAAGTDGEPRDSPEGRLALRWGGDESVVVRARDLRPGDTLVVPSARGGLRAGNWDPEANEEVVDLGDLAQHRARGAAVLRTHPGALRVWGLADEIRHAAPRVPSDDSTNGADEIRAWMEDLPETSAAWTNDWRQLRAALRDRPRCVALPQGTWALYARRDRGRAGATTEDDSSSFVESEVTLARHSRDVKAWAGRFARHLRLPAALAADLELAAALHDAGKADPRFQRWLVGGSEVRQAMLAEPLAKSVAPPQDRAARELARARAGYPRGYRHELLSVAMLEGSEEALLRAHDRDLVLHLVGSHHGWCRPFAPAVDHDEDVPAEYAVDGVRLRATTRHRLARLDSGVTDRFWSLTERYGWWGLAWLECLLRLADHRASEEEGQ